MVKQANILNSHESVTHFHYYQLILEFLLIMKNQIQVSLEVNNYLMNYSSNNYSVKLIISWRKLSKI